MWCAIGRLPNNLFEVQTTFFSMETLLKKAKLPLSAMHAHFIQESRKLTEDSIQIIMHQTTTLHPVQTRNFYRFFAFPAMMPRGAQENNDENVIDHSHEKQSQLEGHHRLS